jgi:hypothetical protein
MLKSHIRIALSTSLILVVFLSLSFQAARADTGPTPTLLNDCCAFTVKRSVPFVWVRAYPSSTSFPRTTIFPGAVVTTHFWSSQSVISWDGVQWWGHVFVAGFSQAIFEGWIELASLEYLRYPTPPRLDRTRQVATWQPSARLHVRYQVPFAWLRYYPSSYASNTFTVQSNRQLAILGRPVADEQQWWWPVRDLPSGQVGWVEQDSLELVSESPAPTFKPTATVITTPEVNNVRMQAAYQPFENGYMLWMSTGGAVYVLLKDGRALSYAQFTYESLPNNPVADVPPAGRASPSGGFGRVWGNYSEVRTALGWALGVEQGYTMTVYNPLYRMGFFWVTFPDNREVQFTVQASGLTWRFSNHAG